MQKRIAANASTSLAKHQNLNLLAAREKDIDEFEHQCCILKNRGVDLAAALKAAGVPDVRRTWDVKRWIAQQAHDRASVKLEITISPWAYGLLCSAAAVHGFVSWEEAAGAFIESNVTEWSGDYYVLD